MNVRRTLLLVFPFLLFPGCAPMGRSARTTIVQPLIYNHGMSDAADHRRYRHMAEAAWGECVRNGTAAGCSCDFASGFKDGFTDYLYMGGTGVPPPPALRSRQPPYLRSYWNPDDWRVRTRIVSTTPSGRMNGRKRVSAGERQRDAPNILSAVTKMDL